jgi:broad specificity phosphatase PhoE
MNLLFVRHGQAGTRLEYDRLSALGYEQATLLGRHLDAMGWRFERRVSGGLRRQRQTAELAYPAETSSLDEGWNEFDLHGVFEGIGPQLALRDPGFASHWQTVKSLTELHGEDEAALVNRRWSPADEMVIRAWVRGDCEFEGESWVAFRARIREGLQRLVQGGQGSAVIFTSATPIAICVGEALALGEEDIFQLAGALLNTSYTELRWRRGKLRLFSFNNTPHLNEAAQRTHR